MPKRLIAANRRIRLVEGLIERQRDQISQLQAEGKSTERAESVLLTFLTTLALFEEHERFLSEELEKKKS